jgi:hypothetical protein
MNKCSKCLNPIPRSIVYNGVEKYLYNRKLCIYCSPYKAQTNPKTQVIHLDCNSFKCILCDRIFIKDRKAGHRGDKCNGCLSGEEKRRKKQKCVNYKGGKCQICGYNKTIKALAFHHIDPKNKSYNIGNTGLGYESMKSELDKCICVCHNCHAEIEAGLINLNNFIQSSKSES